MQYAQVPLVLCAAQFATATMVSRIYLAATRGVWRLMRQGEVALVARVAVVYALGFGTTNLAFSMASAPFVETVKAGEPVSTATLAALLLGERERVATYVSLVPIVLGIAMATGADVTGAVFSLATFVVLASNACFSLRAVFVKQLKRQHPNCAASRSAVVLFYYVSRFGVLAFFIAAVLKGDFASLRHRHDFDVARFCAALLANGIAYASYNLASFMVLNRVSTTTHAVLNVFRRVVVITITSLYFASPLSVSGVTGIALAATGVVLYARSKG